MLGQRLVVILGLLCCGCSKTLPPASAEPTREIASVVRPAWLELVAERVEAARACVLARGPRPAFVVDMRMLHDDRVGIVTIGADGSLERCVHRIDRVEYRARLRDLRSTDFAGRPAVCPGPERPSWGADAYLEEVVSEGQTVAWVHWLGMEVTR